jgi:RsiW-degrading membrane proteinase PrsW (M82 family)
MTGRFRFIQHRWFHVLVGGLVLFIVANTALAATSNEGLVAPVIIIGAFLVPVTFVVYMHGRLHVTDIPVPILEAIFLFGGGLGVVIAGFIEYETLRTLALTRLLGVGLIEESAKLLLPIVIYARGRYRSGMDGLLIGVTCGMGFAALETMGYGVVALAKSHGDVGALDQTLLLRGLLSPAGHAAWTGFVCGVLWSQRSRATHRVLNWAVVGAFALAVGLHASWDALGSITERTSLGNAADWIGLLVVAALSVTLLFWMVRRVGRRTVQDAGEGDSAS